MNTHLSTEPYKGTRDFYPADMAVQQYIFDTWAKTAKSFGFERYDASILEPSELYKSKGAENEEMVNEQTYTFIDRGEREVTLRPEMTPTVARMVAGKRRDLQFPIRWFSIPNLFRYERPQKGRLREHWQLNCDMFGLADYTADVEIISLAYNVLTAFGATPDMFEIRINDRKEMSTIYNTLGILDTDMQHSITRLNDRYHKISHEEYLSALTEIVHDDTKVQNIIAVMQSSDSAENDVTRALSTLGIQNVKIDRSLARGFDYYTGTIFEVFDTDPENNRSLIGGGRYDNLTALFGGEPISGIGFGMGDVTMRNFLESHDLLTGNVPTPAPTLSILPTHTDSNLDALRLADEFRTHNISVSVDLSDKKVGKKLSRASDENITYVIVLGENEITSETYTLKRLSDGTEVVGPISALLTHLQ